MDAKTILGWLTIGIKKPTFRRFKRKIVNPLAGTEKIREFHAPNKDMRELHRRLLGYIRTLKISLPFSTAVLPGCKPIKNVWPHRKNRYFYLIDLMNFYPNIKIEQIIKTICETAPGLKGGEKTVKEFLQKYCFACEGGLRVGAPASPDLANLAAGLLLDSKLAEICQRYKITYTRYLDDLTFSSKLNIGKMKRRAIRQVVIEAGFIINHRKSVVQDIKKKPVIITGVKLEYGGRTMVARSFLRTIRGMIHLAITGRLRPSLVHGRMGAFWSCIPGRDKITRSEAKVANAYEDLKLLIKEGKIVDPDRKIKKKKKVPNQ